MKSKYTAAILAFFLGGLGVHKFYLGQTGLGIIYLIFCWTTIPMWVAFIEGLVFLFANTDEFNAQYNKVEINHRYENTPPQGSYNPSNRCKNCGAVVVGNKFCTSCGTKLN